MINILPHIVQIIMLPARPDTFLTVHGPLQATHLQRRIRRPKKQRLVLIHTRIGEEERGIVVGDAGRGFPEGVAVLLLEEADEGGTDFVHGPFWVGGEFGFVVGGHGTDFFCLIGLDDDDAAALCMVKIVEVMGGVGRRCVSDDALLKMVLRQRGWDSTWKHTVKQI